MVKLIIGSTVALGLLALSLLMSGASLWLYFHPTELIAVLLVPLGILISSFGVKHAFASFPVVLGIRAVEASDESVLKKWIIATYASGAVSLLAGIVLTLAFMSDGPVVIGHKIAAALCAPIYAVLFSEFILRPALVRDVAK